MLSAQAGDWDALSARGQFARGFLAMVPLWVAALPSGIAYAVAAQVAGLSPLATQLMSLLVFSAAGQAGVVATLGAGAPVALLIGTAVGLNAQLLLLGLAAGRQTRPSCPARLLTAFFLTDGAFAIAAARDRLRLPVLLGAGVGMYTGWNLGTALGLVAGTVLPDIRRAGVDFVLPLIFLALLVPLLRNRAALVVAIIAGGVTLGLARVVPTGVATLAAGVAASVGGAWWSRRAAPDGEVAR